MPEESWAPHLFQDLLQVGESFLRGKLQLHDESVYLIDDQNGPDVLQPRLTQHGLCLHTIHEKKVTFHMTRKQYVNMHFYPQGHMMHFRVFPAKRNFGATKEVLITPPKENHHHQNDEW